ncbi:hypothetical protein [Streptomyces sp. AC550_RSS872]|uniref:hypothetical protein n=1 Tax=Streptomyces sp. AC550_RSS872 TaxID=2823689 RepID=UPI001C263005|nr:hypothetical protein [Streptomyces sp. AC550_RSS872]
MFALARLGYQTIKVFYRRSVESWVARTNLEAMPGTELVDPDASGHPRVPSRSGGWLPWFERAEIEDAVRSAPDAEALVVEVTRVGDTLRFARRTMLIFVFVVIVFAVACLLIATR